MNNTKSTKLVFFGSDKNSAKLLDELIKVNYNIKLIITKTSKKTGRQQKQNPVQKTALKYNLKLLTQDKLDFSALKIIKNINPDLGILIAYGSLIPQKIINAFPLGILNIHPSLLPKYRGPSPIQATLLNGDEKTGTSLMLLSEKMDAGPIITQAKIKIEAEDNQETLSQKLFSLGNKLLLNNLEKYIRGKISPQVQDEKQVSFSKIIKKEDGLIDWQNSAEDINNKIRAFYNWPGAYAYFNNKLLKIIKAGVTEGLDRSGEKKENNNHKTGEVFLDLPSHLEKGDKGDDKIIIQTGQGLLYPLIVQLEGKQKMEINPFINGYKNFIGSILNHKS